MSGLLGTFHHALDEKGRLTLPARIRDELGAQFVATRGLDGCVFLYPQAEWAAMEAKLRALPQTQGEVRAFVRLFSARATDCRPDGQGRVLLPQALREHAGLEREAVVVGVVSRVEVWEPTAWERYEREAGQRLGDIAERLGDFGL